MYKYKNKTNQDQVIPGVGFVKAGGEIESVSPIENPNFEYLGEQTNKSVVGTEAPHSEAVVQANKITGTETPEVN